MKKHKIILSPITAFITPFVILLLCFVAQHVYPFGEFNSFISDGNSYYLGWISYWRRILNGLESPFYSFTAGIGGSSSALIACYLLNPYMLLFGLADLQSFPLIYTIVMLLSISTCGLTMYIFLSNLMGKRASNLIFSTSYALCGYGVVNGWQIHWLTGVILLPLVMLGLRKIFQKKRAVMYVITAALAILTNFYIGYMIATCVLIIFLATIISHQEYRTRQVILTFLFGSLLAGLMSSLIWLPGILSLMGGRASAASFGTFAFKENNKLLSIFSRLFTGTHSISELSSTDGLPAIFCGIFPLALSILFFLDKKIEKRKRIAAGTVLGIYLLSFYINTVSVVFQGFSYTIWFNYRYAFIFCFLLISIAAVEYRHFLETSLRNIKLVLAVLVTAAVLIFAGTYSFSGKPYYLIDFAVLGLIFTGWYLHCKDPERAPQRMVSLLCLISVCINLYVNDVICNYETRDWWTNYHDLQTSIQLKQSYVDYIKNQDPSLYRMESEIIRINGSMTDPMMFHYNGVSYVGSVEKTFVKQGLSHYGVQWYDNRTWYDQGVTASMDSLLGLKYLISSRNLEDEKQYTKLNKTSGIGFYRNPYTLSMAMLSDGGITNIRIDDEEDVFQTQNEIWKALTGKDIPLYSEESNVQYTSHNPTDTSTVSSQDTDVQNNSISGLGASLNEDSESGSSAYSSTGSLASDDAWTQLGMDSVLSDYGRVADPSDDNYYVKVDFTASYTGPYYLYDYAYVDKEQGSQYNTLKYLGNYQKGDHVEAKMPLNAVITKSVLDATAAHTYVACLDMNLLKEYSELLNSRDVTIQEQKNKDAKLNGTFTAEKGQKLFFTIPYDEGWTLTVDGVKTRLTKTAGLFMSAEVSEGEHQYELTFMPRGLQMGIIVSGASLLIFFGWSLFRRKRLAETTESCLPNSQHIWENKMKLEDFSENEQKQINAGLSAAEISDKEAAEKILALVPQEWIKKIPLFVRKHAMTKTIERIANQYPEMYEVAKKPGELPEKEREELQEIITDIFKEKMKKHSIK